MVLYITNKDIKDSMDRYVISLENFAKKEYHPFIAANKWSEIIVTVCEDTPKGILRQILPTGRIKVDLVEEDLSSIKVMSILSEVFPDESANLKRLFLKDKDNYYKLVKELKGVE